MATTAPGGTSVPAAAKAVVDLLNSRAYSFQSDQLDIPERAAEVLRAFGQDGVPSPQRLDLVRAVRADLAGLISSHDPGDPAGDWAAFTGRVSSVSFRQDFTGPGEVRLRQVAGDPVIGAITQAVAEIVTAGNWTRVRSCANDECLEVFYDTTRSRTRRWHSYEYCGNRTNVAAYRARNAGA